MHFSQQTFISPTAEFAHASLELLLSLNFVHSSIYSRNIIVSVTYRSESSLERINEMPSIYFDSQRANVSTNVSQSVNSERSDWDNEKRRQKQESCEEYRIFHLRPCIFSSIHSAVWRWGLRKELTYLTYSRLAGTTLTTNVNSVKLYQQTTRIPPAVKANTVCVLPGGASPSTW